MKITVESLFSAALVFLGASCLSLRAQTAASPATNWQTSATVGLTIARGNADTTLFSFSVASEKKWTNNDLKLGADLLYGTSRTPGESTSSETADRDHGFSQWNHTFSDRFFGYLGVEALHDGIADIQYRFTIGPGAGYYFIKNKKLDFSVEGGPAYIAEKLDSTSSSYATMRVAEKLHYQISDHAKLWETIEFLPQVDHFDNYIVNAEIGIEAALNKSNRLALRTVLDDSYDNIPAPDRLKNDLKLIAGITYKF
jgi:putative salt-induced outer membrane protein YdiY